MSEPIDRSSTEIACADETASSGRVAILLATYNGERFLDAQLTTIAKQTVPCVDVHVSDDGSTDATEELLRDWARRWHKGAFTISRGPGKGFAENFRALLTADLEADYVAFCDQDDLWEPKKLEVAIERLSRAPSECPAVFGSRTRAISENGEELGLSPLFKAPPRFENCLVQSLAGGNTIVMNRAAHTLVGEASLRTPFVSHDWWCFQIVTGAGGSAFYEPEPLIRYRQHGANLVGQNSSLQDILRRVRRGWGGQFSDWNERNLAALNTCADLLTPAARQVLKSFAQARAGAPVARLRALRRSGVYRQGFVGQASLYAACLLNRI